MSIPPGQVRALLLPVAGPPRVVPMTPDLEAIQRLVGGFIEGVPIAGDATLYCNEEGKLQGLPLNEQANALAAVTIPWFLQHDRLVGDCVVFGNLDDNGEQDGNEHDVPATVLQACQAAGLAVLTDG